MSQFSFRFPKSSKINPPPIALQGVGRLRINYKVLGFQLVTSWIVFIKKVSNECGTKPVSHLFKRWNINIIKILTRALSSIYPLYRDCTRDFKWPYIYHLCSQRFPINLWSSTKEKCKCYSLCSNWRVNAWVQFKLNIYQ